MRKVSVIWSPLLLFNFKSFQDPNSLSLIRCQCILHDIGVLFSESWNFYKLKRRGPDFWGKRILQKVSIISSPVLYFNFRKFKDPNFFSLIRFQCILYDSVVHFWESWNFYKLKSGELVSWGNWFCRKSELFEAFSGSFLVWFQFEKEWFNFSRLWITNYDELYC